MDFLKVLFENGALDFEAFSQAVANKGFKLADLSKGDYVSKLKYDDDLAAKDTQINTLNGQITQTTTDLQTLQEQMQNVEGNQEAITNLNAQITRMQDDFTKSKDKYEKQLANQQYEFLVKEFANDQKFTSAAAKRDFIRSMTDKKLQVENGKLVGAADYLDSYKNENTDSFVVDNPNNNPNNTGKPFFTTGTGTQTPPPENPFISAMNFTGVRPHNKEK